MTASAGDKLADNRGGRLYVMDQAARLACAQRGVFR